MANIKKTQKNINIDNQDVVLDISQVEKNELPEFQSEVNINIDNQDVENDNFIILNKDFFLRYQYFQGTITHKDLLKIDVSFTEETIKYLKAILIVK